jgi:hypothetical protein
MAEMAATVFDNVDGSGDAPYLQWLYDHPAGLVLNTRRRFDRRYIVLHRATCRSIVPPTQGVNENPFTGRGYIKVCSEHEADLLAWVKQQKGCRLSKRCSLCAA